VVGYLRRVVVLAGGLASAATGPAVSLGRPEGCENVSLATDDVAGSKQVFKNVLRWMAWVEEKAEAAKPLKQVHLSMLEVRRCEAATSQLPLHF
jgi:hypothetical protein